MILPRVDVCEEILSVCKLESKVECDLLNRAPVLLRRVNFSKVFGVKGTLNKIMKYTLANGHK
jgi:hypothetical protein